MCKTWGSGSASKWKVSYGTGSASIRCRSITPRRTIGTSNVDNFKYIRYLKLWCTVNYYVEEPTKLQILHARSQLEDEH
jgi:hypothetical protein